jgi:hypothetical protein
MILVIAILSCCLIKYNNPNPWYCVIKLEDETTALTGKGVAAPLVVHARALTMESCASLAQRRTTSLARGKRWYEETRAADETGGDLSTMAVLMRRSIAWTVVPSIMRQRARIALGR